MERHENVRLPRQSDAKKKKWDKDDFARHLTTKSSTKLLTYSPFFGKSNVTSNVTTACDTGFASRRLVKVVLRVT